MNDPQFLKNHHLYFRQEIFHDQVRSVLTLKDRMGRRVEPMISPLNQLAATVSL